MIGSSRTAAPQWSGRVMGMGRRGKEAATCPTLVMNTTTPLYTEGTTGMLQNSSPQNVHTRGCHLETETFYLTLNHTHLRKIVKEKP